MRRRRSDVLIKRPIFLAASRLRSVNKVVRAITRYPICSIQVHPISCSRDLYNCRRELPEMPTVQISARVIDWPTQCACCCGPANATVAVSHVRTKGVEVIRSEEKSWQVPYCKLCLQHMETERAIDAAKTQQEHSEVNAPVMYRPLVPTPPSPVQAGADAIVMGAFGCTVGLFLFVGLPAAFMSTRIHPLGALALSIIIGMPIVGAIGFGAYYWHGFNKRRAAEKTQEALKAHETDLLAYEKHKREAERQFAVEQARHQAAIDQQENNIHALEKRYRSLLRPGCCRAGLAASYEGWHGTIHTFAFTNPQFANAFIQANSGKIVRGQIG